MPRFTLDEPISVPYLLELALQHPDACYDPERHLPKSDLAKIYANNLKSKMSLFADYFSIYFYKDGAFGSGEDTRMAQEDGDPYQGNPADSEELNLYALPIVIPAIRPFAQELPMFLLRLATEVDYNSTDEGKFISQVADEVSFYYARYVDLLTLQAQAIDYGSKSGAATAQNKAEQPLNDPEQPLPEGNEESKEE